MALAGVAQAQIGDFVWNDINTNGLQDVSEPGISGVIVTLYDSATNAIESVLTDKSEDVV